MKNILFLSIAVQALFIRTVFTQCIQNIAVPNNIYTNNVLNPNNGFAISGINLATNGQPILSNNANALNLANSINVANIAQSGNLVNYGQNVVTNNPSFTTVVPNNGIKVVPNNGINVVAGNNVLTTSNTVTLGNGNSYGGYGTGECSVIGELPITGTTLVTGTLPVIGTVQFNGNLPAGGLVSVIGNSPCTCNVY